MDESSSNTNNPTKSILKNNKPAENLGNAVIEHMKALNPSTETNEMKNVSLTGKNAAEAISNANTSQSNSPTETQNNSNNMNQSASNGNKNKANGNGIGNKNKGKGNNFTKKNNIPNQNLGNNLGINNLGTTLKNNVVDTEPETSDVTKVEGITQSDAQNNSNTANRISLNRLCMNMISHQVVMKLYHFQTQQYGAHKASDAYVEKYAGTMDKFLEVAQGIYGKITLKKYALTGSSHNDENIVKHLDGMITYWKTKINDVLDTYNELINIRDELVADADQLKYLLTFK